MYARSQAHNEGECRSDATSLRFVAHYQPENAIYGAWMDDGSGQ